MSERMQGALQLRRLARRLKERLGVEDIGGEPLEQLVLRYARLRPPELRLSLRAYDPAWPQLFAQERTRLLQALKDAPVVDIQHVGSTAIPGLSGKNIIDLAVAVNPPLDALRYGEVLDALGYRFHGPSPIDPGFSWFWRRHEDGALVIHLCNAGALWFTNLLRSRDYLREHPQEREEYERLKHQLASESGQSWLEYSVLKSHLLQQLTARANAWAEAREGAGS
ncbi:GrpB family protein [Cystobacter ferrugineus]|uniref:GrpB family protein n=1 Tax=Cystobacter ferrugineus TaxID=83449 RepID=A0A1L9BFH3_9BACT|nr:GrpB family protein [Cystobacter ferrugineus]OJH40966.1 hypothetical protein BON30_08630 [Cystobacter ferrugineus]